MEQINFEHAYQLKKLELEALLEVTQAINSNLPEEQLYRIFYFTLRANLNIEKFALYVYDHGRWLCKVSHSSTIDFKGLPLDKTIVREVEELSDTGNLPEVYRKEFQQVFPIRHKEQTLAYMFLNNGKQRLPESEGEMKFVRALTNITIVAIENKKLARQQLEQKAMQKELEIAKDVQRFLFPNSLPCTAGLHVEAKYLPHHQVGGDYYDYIEVGKDKFLLCIADVSGKGVPAAILMANFQASLRTLVRKTTDLEEIVNELNHQVMQNAHGENFITAFLGLYDKASRSLTYVNSGHNPPFLLQKQGQELSTLEKGSTILGIMDKLPFLNVGRVENLEEFLIFLYTDGLTETFNDKDEVWGPEELEAFLRESKHPDLPALIEDLIHKIDVFRNGQPYHDDITLLACAYKGG